MCKNRPQMGRPQGKIILEVVKPNKTATFENGKIT